MSGNIWTPEKAAELTRLMRTKRTAGEIAAVMGISRNAVIGKMNRLKPTYSSKKRPPKPGARARAVPIPAQPKTKPSPTLTLGMMDLQEESCRFPLNDDHKAMLFCGRQAAPESSYCAEHHARCFDGFMREPKTPPQGCGKLGYFDG